MNAIPAVTGLRRRVAALTSVTVAVLALGAAQAGAVVFESGPVWPIPTNAPPAPPPVLALPAAAATAPPASEIADPITPSAVCGDWYLQGDYGDRWPAGSTWWEYRCSHETTFYDNPCTSGQCDGFCWYCSWETQVWTNYFYWDGSNAVFYGEAYSYSLVSEGYLFPLLVGCLVGRADGAVVLPGSATPSRCRSKGTAPVTSARAPRVSPAVTAATQASTQAPS